MLIYKPNTQLQAMLNAQNIAAQGEPSRPCQGRQTCDNRQKIDPCSPCRLFSKPANIFSLLRLTLGLVDSKLSCIIPFTLLPNLVYESTNNTYF